MPDAERSATRAATGSVCRQSAKPRDLRHSSAPLLRSARTTLGLPPEAFGKHWKPTLPSPPEKKPSPVCVLGNPARHLHFCVLQGILNSCRERNPGEGCFVLQLPIDASTQSCQDLDPCRSLVLKVLEKRFSWCHREVPRREPCKNSAQGWHLNFFQLMAENSGLR